MGGETVLVADFRGFVVNETSVYLGQYQNAANTS